MPPKQLQIKRKRQLIEEARKGREARKKLRTCMMTKQEGTKAPPPPPLPPAPPLPLPLPPDSVVLSDGTTAASLQSALQSTLQAFPSLLGGPNSPPPGLVGGCLDPTMGGPGASSSSSSSIAATTATGIGGVGGGGVAQQPTTATTTAAAGSATTAIRTPDEVLKTFSEQWKQTLDQEDLKSLALFLLHIFTKDLEMTHAKAAEQTAKIIGKTDRTIRQWRSDLITHGEIRESRKGKYERPKVLWANKELNDKARAFVEANTAFVVQGKQSTMKIKDFCEWVNGTLLPNQAVASLYSFVPGYGYAPAPSSSNQTPLPRKISLETARKWLRELGF